MVTTTRVRAYRLLFLALLLVGSGLPARAGQNGSRLSSYNVEYLGTVPIDAAGFEVGARLVDGYLYVTTNRNFSIYDVSDPLVPIPLSTTPLGSNAATKTWPPTVGSFSFRRPSRTTRCTFGM